MNTTRLCIKSVGASDNPSLVTVVTDRIGMSVFGLVKAVSDTMGSLDAHTAK